MFRLSILVIFMEHSLMILQLVLAIGITHLQGIQKISA